jgi:hypothetical protein
MTAKYEMVNKTIKQKTKPAMTVTTDIITSG